ncbi:ApeP family dehydratase [Lonepinella sp. BR2357]|uniref:ApeP family dehydratase n=1 Tax=Lonepinella sp. BR2357 TaxID=3434549 RepID=UPI003F6E0DF2
MIDLTCPINDVAPLIPQSGEMALLDRVLAFGDDFLHAQATIYPEHILIQNGVFETLSALEILAQGVAAWAGCMAHQVGEPVRLGYLLGTRKLHIYQAQIPLGTCLDIKVKLSLQDSTGMGVFDTQLFDGEKLLLSGALNVFSPKE